MSFITAIVVAFDSAAALPECLGALKEAGVPTIVVDNASSDASARIAEGLGATRHPQPAQRRLRARQQHRARAPQGASSCSIVNPDVVIEPGTVAELLDAARRYPEAGFFAPKIVEPDGRVFFQPRSLLAPYLRNPRGKLVLPEGDACGPFFSGACFL